MGRKDEERQARLTEALRRDRMKTIIALLVDTDNHWRLAGQTYKGEPMPAVTLTPEGRRFADDQWQKIWRWYRECVPLIGGMDAFRRCGRSFYESAQRKTDAIASAVAEYVPENAGHTARLAAFTAVLEALLHDLLSLTHDHRHAPRTLLRVLGTFCRRMVPIGSALNLGVNGAYYLCRDEVLEHPDWSVYDGHPPSEMDLWIAEHPDDPVAQAARIWMKKQWGAAA